MSRVVIDSSVFLSALIDKEKRRLETLLFFRKLWSKKQAVYVPSLVIAEVINRLQRIEGENRADAAYRFLMSFVVIDIDNIFLKLALPYWSKFRLKTSDAIIAITSAVYEGILVSWDEKLISEAGKVTKAVTPAEFVQMT